MDSGTTTVAIAQFLEKRSPRLRELNKRLAKLDGIREKLQTVANDAGPNDVDECHDAVKAVAGLIEVVRRERDYLAGRIIYA